MSMEIKHAEFCVLVCFFPGNPKMSSNPHIYQHLIGVKLSRFKASAELWNQNSEDEYYTTEILEISIVTVIMIFWTSFLNFLTFHFEKKLLQALVLHSCYRLYNPGKNNN